MKKDNYLKAKNFYKDIDEYQDDINHIQYVLTRFDVDKFTFAITEGSKIHITRNELKMLLANRAEQIRNLENEIEAL